MTQSLTQLQALVKQEVNKAYEIAEKHYGVKIPRIPVVFCNRLTRVAGHFTYSFNKYKGKNLEGVKLTFSNKIMALNGMTFVDETPAHETAHHIAVHLWGRQGLGHDEKWSEVMKLLGKKPNRYHSMETARRNTFRYVDTEGNAQRLTKGQHQKLQSGSVISYTVKSTGALITKSCLRE